MRARHEIREQLYRNGEHDSDELQELQLEILMDIRDLLQRPPCNCAETKKDGESEHWPSCRYA